jgi:hypothetical protein
MFEGKAEDDLQAEELAEIPNVRFGADGRSARGNGR